MFIIKYNDKKHLWCNQLEDDFLKYLPGHFECEAKDLKVELFDPKTAKEIRNLLSDSSLYYSFGSNELIFNKKHDHSVFKKFKSKNLKAWPYDQNGKFTKHEVE